MPFTYISHQNHFQWLLTVPRKKLILISPWSLETDENCCHNDLLRLPKWLSGFNHLRKKVKTKSKLGANEINLRELGGSPWTLVFIVSTPRQKHNKLWLNRGFRSSKTQKLFSSILKLGKSLNPWAYSEHCKKWIPSQWQWHQLCLSFVPWHSKLQYLTYI